jgi:hypothetical protein
MRNETFIARAVVVLTGLALAGGFLRAATDSTFRARQAELRKQWQADQQRLGYTPDGEGRKKLYGDHPSPQIALCKATAMKPGASAAIEVTGTFPEGTVVLVDHDGAKLGAAAAGGSRFSTTVTLAPNLGPRFVTVHFFTPVSGATAHCAIAFANVAQGFDLKADNGWLVRATPKAASFELDRNGYALLDYAVDFSKPGEARPFQSMTARRQIQPGATDDGQFSLSLSEVGSGAMAELTELQKKLADVEALMKMPDKERDALMDKLTRLSEKAMQEQMAAVSDPVAMQRKQDEFGCQTLMLRLAPDGTVGGSVPCGKNVGTLTLSGSAKAM